jgi:hypothetical protein
MNEIKNPKFFTAGRAVFTVDNGKGTHYTFRIGRKNDTQPLFVSLLTGPDNNNSFTYLGIFNPETNEIRLTAKSRYTDETLPVKVVRWAVKAVVTNKIPEGYAVQHAGKCCRCGRTLTTPESVNRGWGPECDKYMS